MKQTAKQTFKQTVKQTLALTLALLLLLNFAACSFFKEGEAIDWGVLELNQLVPEFESACGRVISNLDEHLSVTLNNIEKQQYEDYLQACIEKGFTIDSERDSTSYEAFNSDGYKLRLSYYQNNLNISVDAPEEMDEFEWPTIGIATIIPQTESTLGRISWNTSATFIVHVGETTLDEYKDYVKSCEITGFTIDYSKDEKYYSAKNADGYKLTLRYLGFNRIEVSLSAPENAETTGVTQETQKTPEDTLGGTYGWRDFLKDYEAWVDSYIEIYQKYKANPTDMSILSDYMKVVAEMSEWTERAEDMELEIKDTADALEYSQELLRIVGKLTELN